MKFKLPFKSILLTIVIFCLGFQVFTLHRKVIQLRKSFHKKMKKHKVGLRVNEFAFYKVFQNRYDLPKELKNVPYLGNDIVTDVKEIKIRNAFAPYNASIIEQDKGFLLFFRYDVMHQLYYNKIHTRIGCAELDENLNQSNKEFVIIDTCSDHSEDPRVVKAGEEYYLVYNDIFDSKEKKRGMHLAHLDLATKKVKTVVPLDLRLNHIEKNWAPFAYQGLNQNTMLCFEYQVSHPRQILSMDNLENPDYVQITQQKDIVDHLLWTKKWGKPLGGTPARLVDGEYLSFFHSKFRDRSGVYWYVMGAYTFEPTPPFRITRISPNPILFEGIYDSEYRNTAEPCKCIIFPCGYAIKQRNGHTILYLACGENDSAIKVVAFDKDALLETLTPVY